MRTSENEREQLHKEKQRLISQQRTDVRLTTPPRGMTTPVRPTSPTVPDTPSKDLVLEEEPHGAEFEVSGHFRLLGTHAYIGVLNVSWG